LARFAQVALKWLLGRAPDPIDPYALLLQAAALEAMHRAGQARRGTPVDPAETDPEVPGHVEADLADLASLFGDR
jgi:hypothetical protein